MYTAIILDPRPHPAFFIVLDNFLNRLDERWNFIIFCGNFNYIFLIDAINNNFLNHKHRIKLIKLNINNVNLLRHEYDDIFLSIEIYDFIPTEMFLVFQLDTMISDIYYNNIYDFMNYDYVGAPWFNDNNYDNIHVGNGGLSLRRKSKMLEIIKNEKYKKYYNEDMYFSGYYDINKPHYEEAKKFSVETYFYDKSFGVHNPWYSVSFDNINTILTHIPKLNHLYTALYTSTLPTYDNMDEKNNDVFNSDKVLIIDNY